MNGRTANAGEFLLYDHSLYLEIYTMFGDSPMNYSNVVVNWK